MSGILSGRERLMDTVLTSEGRKQLASGQIRARYVSFTDSGTIYNVDTIVSGSGLENGTKRFTFEAAGSLPKDSVTLETDDSGMLQAFPVQESERYVIRQGQVLSGSQSIRVTGSQFASLAGSLLQGSINNFKDLHILKSPDPIDGTERVFQIGPESVTFTITDKAPFASGKDIKVVSIDNVESLFYDKRLSHIPNFQFLPPVNSSNNAATQGSPLGTYVNLSQAPITTFEDIQAETKVADMTGFSETIRFTETSRQNNLACQLFELADDNMISKLDVIDFGEFPSPNNNGTRHVFFAGKVFEDSYGSQTFVNLFMLCFESATT